MAVCHAWRLKKINETFGYAHSEIGYHNVCTYLVSVATMILNVLFLVNLASCEYFMNRINHMEYYRNRTRPSKAFSSFSTNYFNQNMVPKPGKEKVQCGTRIVDFNPRRTGKIVGGTETPYGAYPWQVSHKIIF
jgi:hypothetical protein